MFWRRTPRAEAPSPTAPPAAVERDGFRLFVAAGDTDIGGPVRAGTFEPEVEAAFRNAVRPGATVVDVGANIGFYTMLAAHLVGPAGHVVAVEPVDKNLQLVQLSLVANGFRHVEVWPFAASDVVEIVRVETHDRTSNAQVQRGPAARPGDRYAPARPLDPFLAGLDRLDVLKIDVEGFEPRALAGMAAALARFQPTIISEFHPQALEQNAGVAPAAYAATLLAMAPDVVVLQRDAPPTICRTPDEVITAWRAANARLGFDGALHLDLLVVPATRRG